jgi:DNA-binding beta-propeller fold protein YncE
MPRFLQQLLRLIIGLWLACCALTLAQAQTVTASPSVGTAPEAVALNPVTNKIYVANTSSANVTVIEGATNTTSTVATGTTPSLHVSRMTTV